MNNGLTKNQIETERDWTKGMVKKFLIIQPIGKKCNPIFHSIKCDIYDLGEIEQIEESQSFKEYVAKNVQKRSASKAAGETRAVTNAKTKAKADAKAMTEKIKIINNMTISFKKKYVNVPLDELKKRSISSHKEHQEYLLEKSLWEGWYFDPNYVKQKNCDDSTLNRLTVNYIRHHALILDSGSIKKDYDSFIEIFTYEKNSLIPLKLKSIALSQALILN